MQTVCGYDVGAISGLPLIYCPECGDRVIEFKSRKNGGKVFFKCIRNEQYVSSGYWMFAIH